MSITIGSWQHSEGKASSDRNDDFVLIRKIFNYRVLGLLGDFTSDSQAGINTRLEKEMNRFIDERLEMWKDMLLAPDRILNLVARHINKWLADRRGDSRTTLVAMDYNAKAGMLHYTTVGDSGLGLGGPSCIDLVVKGDTSGVRDASGFLPLDAADFKVEQRVVEGESCVFAYTDGFWENTQHFLDPDRMEDVLLPVFGKGSALIIGANLKESIYGGSSQQDDLSMLVLKAEGSSKVVVQDYPQLGLEVASIEDMVLAELMRGRDSATLAKGGRR